MRTNKFLNSLCHGDLQRYINILEAYNELDTELYIEDVGYNPNSGYVYLSLENGISICEAFNGVEYLVTNMENGEEYFFDTYEEATMKQNEIN